MPRGGGAAIVLVGVTAGLMAMLAVSSGARLLPALAGAVAIAALGFADDARGLSAWLRLTVQTSVAIAAVAILGRSRPSSCPGSARSSSTAWVRR